jgi:PhnB protein
VASELTPYLCVADARKAIEWYTTVLGAEVSFEPIVMPDNRVGHVELSFDGATVMMADEHPELNVEAPAPTRGNDVTLHLTVEDIDGLVDRVRESGVNLDRGPEDTEHGRVAVFRDPFGHRWFLNQLNN